MADDAVLIEQSWKTENRDRALTVLVELIPAQSKHFNKLKTENGEFTLLLDMNKKDYQEMITVFAKEKFTSADDVSVPDNADVIRYKLHFITTK